MTRKNADAQSASIKLPRVNQIGIVVKDIPSAVARYESVLGIGPWFRSKTVKHETSFRGKSITVDLDLVLAFQGGTEIELIELRGGDECIYSELLRKSGGGLHHVGSIVSSYDRAMKRVNEAGVGVIQSGVITTKGGTVTRYAYLDTVKQCGIITEIIESKLFGIPMAHNKFLMSIGCITGNVERVRA
jgi:catechol 2,3-dioxygenase-like lactoylglutathione lyase family enzyme